MGILEEDIAQKLVLEFPVDLIFHHPLKVHRKEVPVTGRPSVTSTRSLGEPLGDLMNTLIQPLLLNLPTYLHDTKHVIQRLENRECTAEDTWLTCDTIALHSCILQDPA